MRNRVYLEITIPSYLAAWPSRDLIVAAHQQITHDGWNNQRANFEIYISQFVIDEAEKGNAEAAKRRLEFLKDFQLLNLSDNVAELSAAFIDSGVIPHKSALDAAHLAVATVHNMDFLLT
jgi:hypothetical protein